ncbi:hypothetical protein Drorol1_Dr00020686 [Drosera rotundifolia]
MIDEGGKGEDDGWLTRVGRVMTMEGCRCGWAMGGVRGSSSGVFSHFPLRLLLRQPPPTDCRPGPLRHHHPSSYHHWSPNHRRPHPSPTIATTHFLLPPPSPNPPATTTTSAPTPRPPPLSFHSPTTSTTTSPSHPIAPPCNPHQRRGDDRRSATGDEPHPSTHLTSQTLTPFAIYNFS